MQRRKKLCISHIIPKSFYENVDHRRYTRDKIKNPKLLHRGEVDNNILCEEHDRLIGIYDEYANYLLVNEINKYKKENCYIIPKENFDYDKLRKFIVSLIWRASITKNNFFENVSLGPYEKKALQIIKGINNRENTFGFCIYKLDGEQNKYLQRMTLEPYTEYTHYHRAIYHFTFKGLHIKIFPNTNNLERKINFTTKNNDLVINIDRTETLLKALSIVEQRQKLVTSPQN